MEVGRGEQFALTCLEPTFAGARLTFRAVPIAAAVIRDGGTMSTAGAFIDVAARAAVRQRAMASRTLIWVQRIHRRVRSVEAGSSGRGPTGTPQSGRPLYFSPF